MNLWGVNSTKLSLDGVGWSIEKKTKTFWDWWAHELTIFMQNANAVFICKIVNRGEFNGVCKALRVQFACYFVVLVCEYFVVRQQRKQRLCKEKCDLWTDIQCIHVVIGRHILICQACIVEYSEHRAYFTQIVSVLTKLYSVLYSTESDVMIPLNVANRNLHTQTQTHIGVYGKIKAKQNKFYYNIKYKIEEKWVQMKP